MTINWGARFARLLGKSNGNKMLSRQRASSQLRLERLEDRTVPSVLIPVTNHRAMVYDQARNILDITTSSGALQRFSLSSQTLQPSLNIGLNLAGADITADNSTLVVADQGIASAQVLDRINLQTNQVSSLGSAPYSSSDPSWDLALGTGAKGLFDDTSSSVPVRVEQFDYNSGAVTFRQDATGSKGKGLIGSGSLISRSADRSTFLIPDTGSTNGAVFTYNALTDTFSAPVTLPFSLVGASTAVNLNGSLFAVQVNGSTYVLNQNLKILLQLGGMDGGVAFDPTQNLMYAVSSTQGQIVTFNTTNWAITNQMPIGETVPRSTPMGNGAMTVTTNGWLFLATPSGVRGYQLSVPVSISSFALSGAPTTATAGAPFQFAVIALGANGQTLTNYAGTVHFTITDLHNWLAPADYTFVPADQGKHIFTMSFWQAGPESISVADKLYPSANGTLPSPIQISPGPSQNFGTTYYGNSTYGEAAGYTIPFYVQVYDGYGNITPNYTGTVHFTSSDPAAQLPADYTYTAADKGVHEFLPILDTAGYQSITVKDVANSTNLNLTTNNIKVSNVIPGLYFTFTPVNGNVTAGQASGYTVTAWDYNNQVATHYVGTVTFASSDPGSGVTLPTNYTFTAADAGVHTFNATLTTAGTQTVSVHDTTVTGTTVSTSVAVLPAAASTLQVSGFPGSVTAGDSGAITVTAYDAYGNVATGYNGTLDFSSTDGQASLPAPSTLTNGAGTFAATLFTAGTQSLTAADSVNAALSATQGGIAVSPAAASSLQVAGFPTSTTAGVAGTFTVTAYDAYGNVATGYAGTVQFTSSDGRAGLPADSTLTNGSGTFSATLITAGMQSLTAADASNIALTATEANIAVNPAAAAALVLSAPSTVTVGVSFTFTITLEDAYGNVATGYVGTIHFSSSDTSAGLPADYTFGASDAGVATFTAVFNTTGAQTLTASDDFNNLNNTQGVFVQDAS